MPEIEPIQVQQCPHKKSCDKKTVQRAWIEHLVVILTRDFVLRDEVINRLATAVVELQKRENTIIPFLQNVKFKRKFEFVFRCYRSIG